MTTIHRASHQWATRPADERFASLTDMLAFLGAWRDASVESVVPSKSIEARPVAGDREHKQLVIVGPKGNPIAPTHWAFGQLASLAGAPAAYLRKLAAPLAADCVNFGLKVLRPVEDVKVLIHRNGGEPLLCAATGPGYGRIWNAAIVADLVDRFGDGVTGKFRVPGEFGKAVRVTKANTTLYASDRDMFVFLADEERRIEVPNTRSGATGKRSLARGFFVWNSDVGKTSYGIAMFIFDYVCCNRIVWGAEGLLEVTGRHTVSAPDRWLDEIAPAIEAFSTSSVAPAEARLLAAQRKKLDDVEAFLAKRFSRPQVAAIVAAHGADEGRPMESLWDVATGITAYARGIEHQDRRIDVEREAGKVLDMAA